jgi:predicted amidohydrolase
MVTPLALPTFDLVLRGGRVIDPARDVDGRYDVGIRDGKIAAVQSSIDKSAAWARRLRRASGCDPSSC